MQQNLWLPRESDRVIDNKLKKSNRQKVTLLLKNAVLGQIQRSCIDKLVQTVERIGYLRRCWGADTYCMSPSQGVSRS